MKLGKVLKFKGIGNWKLEKVFHLSPQSVDKFTIFTDFTVTSLRFIPAFIGGDE